MRRSSHSTLTLALRLLAREWRAGELRILAGALVIAVAATTTINLFTDRINRALAHQSAELIGADLLLASPRTVPEAWLAQAGAFGLRTARTLEFASVVIHGDDLLLTSVRAVGRGFPLRGGLRTSEDAFAPDAPTHALPAPGTAWVEARLLSALKLAPGAGARIEVGAAEFRITRVLTYEPGRGGNFFSLSPRVLLNLDDVERTGVVRPGSKVTWRYLFAGDPDGIEGFSGWLRPRLEPSHNLLGPHEDSASIGTALERAERYLGLASLVAVLLAGVAIAMGARRYSERHFDVAAMLRCLGTSQRELLGLYLPQLFLLGLAASAAGCALGWAAHAGLLYLLRGLLPPIVPSAGPEPLLLGFATGLVALAGFAAPPWLRLRKVPPLRVLRRELEPMPTSAWVIYGAAAASIVALMWRYTGSATLTLTVLAGAVAAAAALAAIAYGLLLGSHRLQRGASSVVRVGFGNLWRRGRASVGQILAFGLTLMAMAVIALVRTDLLSTWQRQLPEHVPNHFAFNILPDEVPALERFFAARGIVSSALYPMVRGRLTAINDVAVREAVTKEARDDGALNRELNLTWTNTLPPDNSVLAGRWWRASEKARPLVSVEQKLAQRLGIRLGDRLTFVVGGQTLDAEVASLRRVQWDSFHPNFFMIFPPGVLDAYPATYLTSFHLASGQKRELTALVREFPSVTVVEMDLVLARLRAILRQVTAAVEYVLLFVLAAGLAVLYAALTASLDERLYEGALLRTLGASRRQLRLTQVSEFVALGALAGLLAALGTELVAYLLYVRVFDLEYSLKWQVWLLAPPLGALIVGVAGYLGTRPVLRTAPLAVFRRLQ